MLPTTIKFQAFIPKSLGRPLLSYFERNHLFSSKYLSNYDDFRRKLLKYDRKGYNWLPEPGGSFTDYYFATDNADSHSVRSSHTNRLSVELRIEYDKVGNYKITDRFLFHDEHANWGGNSSQHSNNSHRIRAYIKRMPFYTDMPKPSDKDVYVGFCDDEVRTMRSYEEKIKIHRITNSHSDNRLFSENNTTVIELSASAEYPFLKYVAPKIDFNLELKMVKKTEQRSLDFFIRGWHNNFPAYELILNNFAIYNHNPSNYGYEGPSLVNLNTRKNFQKVKRVYF